MTSRTITSDEARARAEQRFQKGAQREREAEAAQKAEADRRKATEVKMEHLRALRLAREAGEATPAQAEANAENEKRRAELLGLEKPAPVKRKASMRPRKAAPPAFDANA
jgi:membrane protein involved in colicin uptake